MDSLPFDPRVRDRRETLGLSQVELAGQVGISRQALGAIEAGRQVPSTLVALRLGRVLGCRVEDLFRLDPPAGLRVRLPEVSVGSLPARAGGSVRLALGWVDGRWVGHPLGSDGAEAADALVTGWDGRAALLPVEPLVDPGRAETNLLVAGCAPALGGLAQRTGLRFPDARMTWLPANSARALELLADGLVHVAGVHHARDSQETLEWVATHLPGRSFTLVTLAGWRQGILTRAGNPLGIEGAEDLARPGMRLALREPGAGASELLSRALAAAGARRAAAPGDVQAGGHMEVAALVAAGAADAGIAIENAAFAQGLAFRPLSEERFDLVIPTEALAARPTERLLDLLADAAVRRELAALAGYDSEVTGERRDSIDAGRSS